jgi:nickel superoxide dismutase
MERTVCDKLKIVLVLVSVMVFASIVYSHCQIPCGIYGDEGRFDMIAENITTIEKSITLINQLSKQQKPNYNQIVRWIQNKEKHADDISHIVTYYFLAQRIKPADKSKENAYKLYIERLTLLHEMLFYSMKAKQTTDLKNVEKLREVLVEFRTAYLDKNSKKN